MPRPACPGPAIDTAIDPSTDTPSSQPTRRHRAGVASSANSAVTTVAAISSACRSHAAGVSARSICTPVESSASSSTSPYR
jgi:hypothetical protein